METEEENGEGEDIVEDVDAQAVADDAVTTGVDDFSVTVSLTPRDLTEHCLSCFRRLIRS